jgi:hypothetical protein
MIGMEELNVSIYYTDKGICSSPNSFIRIYRMLLKALWLSNYSSDVLGPMRVKISRIEKYEVKSLEGIKSLFRHQAMVGVRK